MANGKNELIKQSASQVDNYDVKPESFPMKGVKPVGQAEGKDKLATGMCESPRRLESMGGEDLRPSVWGMGGKGVFAPSVNKGESEEGSPSKVSMDCSVDLKTGQSVPNVADYRR